MGKTSFRWPKYDRKLLAIGFLCMIILGFVSSRALMSIGMISLACNFILNTDLKEDAKRYTFFRPFPLFAFIANTFVHFDLPDMFRRFWKQKDFIFLVLFFLYVALSGFWSENLAEFGTRLRIKLPLLALPLAIGALKEFNLKEFKFIFYFFILTILFSSFVVLFNYLANYEMFNEAFYYGKSIPVPFNHIRFSLMLALAAVGCFYFLGFRSNDIRSWEKITLPTIGIFLIVMIHILSVRSGMLALYIGLLYLLYTFIIKEQKWILGLIGTAFIVLIPVLAYHFIPSVNNKVDYMIWDLKMYQQEATEYYSDTRRLMSMEVGLAVAHSAPVFGVGTGDLIDEVHRYYEVNFPVLGPENHKLPHNQFIYTLAAQGAIGLVLLCLAFGVPFFYRKNYQNPLLGAFLLMIGSSFLTEHTLEAQLGTAFCLTMLVILLNFQKSERTVI